MPSSYPAAPLFEVADVVFGFPFDSTQFNTQGSGIPLVRIRNLDDPASCLCTTETGFPDSVRVRPGDLLVGMDAEFRPHRWSGPHAVLNQRVCKVVPKTGTPKDREYLRAVVARPLRHLEWAKSGTTVIHLNKADLDRVLVPWPPVEQRHIVGSILSVLDDKIELNRRMNESLEAMARALFKSWFVDFDPVRAKAEGRDPGLPQPIADLFPDRFEDSELGEIPVGWHPGVLGDIAEHPRRGVAASEIDRGTPYIALEHMPRRSIALGDWDTADGVASGKFEFRRGEMLFGKLRPYFHKVGIAPIDGVCSTDIVVVRPTSEEWFGIILTTLSSDHFVEHISAGSTGTKMPRTSWSEMARHRLSIPSSAVARAFTGFVQPMADRIVASIHESRTLAATRDALLPKLISGEIRVAQAERALEAAPA